MTSVEESFVSCLSSEVFAIHVTSLDHTVRVCAQFISVEQVHTYMSVHWYTAIYVMTCHYTPAGCMYDTVY